MDRPLKHEPNEKLRKELRDMAELMDQMATSIFHPKEGQEFSPADVAAASILQKVMGAYWSNRGDILREAAHRLDPSSDPAPGAAR